MPDVGDIAPDFTLPGNDGEVTLSRVLQNSKVLLAFYAEDNTPTCVRELSTLREEYPTIQELSAEVLAISVDPLESHASCAEKEGGFPFPLLSDHERSVSKAYDVLDETGRRSRRALFVIDQEGKVQCAIPHYNPANSGQFLEAMESLGLSLE
jgi:peroxiredoxin Q/BCP